MKNKFFKAYAQNASGATTSVIDYDGSSTFTSLTAAVRTARLRFGAGWWIEIYCHQIDGDGKSWFKPELVKEFRIIK
jgi:hypothetical protein